MHEYECKDCGTIDIRIYFGSEKVQEEIKCSACQNIAKKILSSPSFQVPQRTCGNAESGYSDVRNVKPMDQKRNIARAQSEADKLNRGQNPR
jgi:DNA-directed RNA polymerase subunit RPC12/RpoP